MVFDGIDVGLLLNEAGGHRVQRVPPTERRGRVHTSTVTVAVLQGKGSHRQKARHDPRHGCAEEACHPCSRRSESDYRVEWFRGSGAGGQHRNKHANSARVIHLPTGLKQECQGRRREANLHAARTALDDLLDAGLERDARRKADAVRASQIGSGMRGDKRRTYRFQDDTVTDHVSGKRARLSQVMKGDFDVLWPA